MAEVLQAPWVGKNSIADKLALFRVIFSSLSLVFFLIHTAVSSAYADFRFGIWIEVEGKNQPFRSKADFSRYKSFVSSHEFTDLYVQVYRGGRSWYRSRLADQLPYEAALAEGFDPLEETIKLAHSQGKRVHAWLNALRIDQNRNAPIFHYLGPDAVLTDSNGNSFASYSAQGVPPSSGSAFQLDTPGIWLDPSNVFVRNYLAALVSELLANYPELDGVHLDMIRLPYVQSPPSGQLALTFPFSKEALQKYRRDNKLQDFNQAAILQGLPAEIDRWNNWRRAQVSAVVSQISDALKKQPKKIELSCAVLASNERAFSYAMQDWKDWLRRDLVDFVLPMNYTVDYSTFKQNARYALEDKTREKIIIGLGAWLFVREPELLVSQADTARSMGAPGVTLFSYSNLLSPLGERAIELLTRSYRRSAQHVDKN